MPLRCSSELEVETEVKVNVRARSQTPLRCSLEIKVETGSRNQRRSSKSEVEYESDVAVGSQR